MRKILEVLFGTVLLAFPCYAADDLREILDRGVVEYQSQASGKTVIVQAASELFINDDERPMNVGPVDVALRLESIRLQHDLYVPGPDGIFSRYSMGFDGNTTVSVFYDGEVPTSATKACAIPKKKLGADVNFFAGPMIAFGRMEHLQSELDPGERSFLRWFIASADEFGRDPSDGNNVFAKRSMEGVKERCDFRLEPYVHCVRYTTEKQTRDGAIRLEVIEIGYNQSNDRFVPTAYSRELSRTTIAPTGVTTTVDLRATANVTEFTLAPRLSDIEFLPEIAAGIPVEDLCASIEPRSTVFWLWALLVGLCCVVGVLFTKWMRRAK